jgi:para-aminobenzoate synthetase component 1
MVMLRVPMFHSIPLPYLADAADYYATIADLPWAMWLDSAGLARYDILCAEPVATLTVRDDGTEIADHGGVRRSTDNPFDLLREHLGSPMPPIPDIPFAGGALGYWSYDLARRDMGLPAAALDAEQLPLAAIGIYDWAIVLDHRHKSAALVSRLRHPATRLRLPHIARWLRAGRKFSAQEFQVRGDIRSNFTRATYGDAFDAVQRYLQAGDCYQVNLAQRFVATASGDALAAYLELRRICPAPCSAFLNLPQMQILCASPEQFLRVRAGQVETRPIKGTRARMNDEERDAAVARELQNSPKDRAENLMIVDLLRNDLGKSCAPGSVKVAGLFELERYSHVHHLVSTVTGHLANGQDAVALLKNCFPGGSVTGAPKRRAMQIIEQLEPHRRGVYCGAIGYIGHDGDMDSNIVIRTLVYSGTQIRFWAGGGIVADSAAAAEYRETLDKADAMLELLRRFGACGQSDKSFSETPAHSSCQPESGCSTDT